MGKLQDSAGLSHRVLIKIFWCSQTLHQPGTGYDSHSFVLLCRVFGISCLEVYEKLVSQIMAWQIKESCWYAGERCSYEVRNISSQNIIEIKTNYMHDFLVKI